MPRRFKHAHSINIATSEHISVHCCVNAAGNALPPMIIYSGGYPGGPYHKNGPVNAAYSTTDSGFMDRDTYFQWFQKVFLQYCVKDRPVLLLQDGAVSHISPMLIECAIENNVILLCLPSKTTHILQPLDVAVYKTMKTETAKQISHAKMLKTNFWVSKKNVSSIFRTIFERSFTIACITQGFRKCGIYPFNPNAIDKTLLLRCCKDATVNPEDLDLSSHEPTNETETEKEDDALIAGAFLTSLQPADDTEGTTIMELNVGPDGILTPVVDSTNTVSKCPPALALKAIESALTPKKKRSYEEAFTIDSCSNIFKDDVVYQTWKQLRKSVDADVNGTESQTLS